MKASQIATIVVVMGLGAPALNAQEGNLRPFIGVGLTDGPRGNWSAVAGVSVFTAQDWKLSVDVTTYFDGIATGRHWTTFGLEARTPPLLNDRTYFFGGPRVSWIRPALGGSLGVGYFVGKKTALEASIHQERFRRQLGVGLRISF